METIQTTLSNGVLFVHDVRDPSVILNNVSPSKLVTHPGTGSKLIAMRHDLRNVQRLAVMGIKAPSPVLTDYQWTGKFKPFSHQRETVDFLTKWRQALVLSDMGTGKTAAALWACDYLKKKGLIRKALIVCPLSCVNRVWMDEIWSWVPHLTGQVLHAGRDKRKYLARRSQADFLIINHDGMGVVKQELIDRRDIDLIIYDEASALRNHQTDRYKLFRSILNQTGARLWMLTGTPTPNAPTDAWALARLVNPMGTERSFTRFRESTMVKVSQFKWVPRRTSDIVVRKVLQPAVRHKKEDCIDLPSVTHVRREVAMSKEQAKAFAQMKKDLRAEAMNEKAEGKPVTALNAASRMIKLLQISTGSVYADDGSVVDLPIKDRLKVLMELIDASRSKTIVCVPFRHTIARVHDALVKQGYRPGVVHGGVTGLSRDRVIQQFQQADDMNPLIVQPRTASHGLNLTCASTMVWYGPVFSAESYQQANERMARPGQQNKMTIAHLGDNAVEWGAYDVVAEKGHRQTRLLSLYEEVLTK